MRPIVILACLAAGACGDDDSTTTADASSFDAPAVTVDGGPGADAAPLSAYEGTWATREILATVVQAPIVGPVNNRAVTLGKATATVTGDTITLTIDICAMPLETDNTSLTTALLPGYAANQIANISFQGQLVDGKLEAIGGVQLQSCTLSQPETEALPTSGTDPRVTDADADSHPGFTVVTNVTGLGEVRIYMVQRTRRDLTGGSFTSPDRVYGKLTIHQFEESVLGATNAFFATTPAIAPNAAGSSFTMVRSDLDCAGIAAADEATLFGPR